MINHNLKVKPDVLFLLSVYNDIVTMSREGGYCTLGVVPGSLYTGVN